jgi:hypothetical protein
MCHSALVAFRRAKAGGWVAATLVGFMRLRASRPCLRQIEAVELNPGPPSRATSS